MAMTEPGEVADLMLGRTNDLRGTITRIKRLTNNDSIHFIYEHRSIVNNK
jgi:hypothetical protein